MILDEVEWGEAQEPEVLEAYQSALGKRLFPLRMPERSPLDYIVFEKDRSFYWPAHFLEVKVRRCKATTYETTLIPLAKITMAQRILDQWKIPSFAVIRYTDGLWRWDVTKQPETFKLVERPWRDGSIWHGEYPFSDGERLADA